jgi:hypothetical protein
MAGFAARHPDNYDHAVAQIAGRYEALLAIVEPQVRRIRGRSRKTSAASAKSRPRSRSVRSRFRASNVIFIRD